MRFTSVVSLATLASSLLGAIAQGLTATIFLPGGETPPESLAGEVVGVGADGTTIVVTNVATGTDAIPFTQTVVQDASHVSLVAVNPIASGASLSLDVQCLLSASGVGDCLIAGGAFSSDGTAFATTTLVGMLTQLEVPVSTASGFSTVPTSGATASSQAGSATSSPSPGSTSAATVLNRDSLHVGVGLLMTIAIYFL